MAAFSPEPGDERRPSPTEAPADTWRPPPVVGRYYVERILGSGGMGQVYRAWDTELRRRVAMKFILGIEPDATARERFLVEACATARIQHPNVLTIHDVAEIEGRPYLVMEYLSGRTLDKMKKPMPWSRALEIGVALSAGLAAAHRQSVLHRDIKPNNAILTDDGLVKLLDFGLAKLATRLSTPSPSPPPVVPTLRARGADDAATTLPATGDGAALTNTGAIVGTPGYMAPESWLGQATPRSDVYSLGALLFELCAGRTPHAEAAINALSVAVQTRDAPLLTEVMPSVDPMFAAVIARCLARDPGARPASGEELHEALKALERPVLSRPFPSSRSRSASPTMAFREIGSLVVSVHSADPPTDGEWRQYLGFCRAKMERERLFVLVLTAGGSPTAKQRMALRSILPAGPVLAAVVTDVHTVHGIVTAMGWFNPGIRAFGFDKGAGLCEALKYLEIGDPAADRVLAEITAMQRELRAG